jgi:8-amino-7-oxononanoate synthase
MLPERLQKKIQLRKENKSLRTLKLPENLIDFSSNDYLGFSKKINEDKEQHSKSLIQNGATGSRLLSGHSHLFETTEKQIAEFHYTEAALLYNSGYDANLGLLSAILLRGDVVIYDEWSHASIRDGITMGFAKTVKFKHNDLDHLQQLLEKFKGTAECYIVTETIFSMDGDQPDLKRLVHLSQMYNANLIVDEAHAIGVFGNKGQGLIQHLGLESKIFARIVTYGKALGCHGASILGSNDLKEFLINFSRPFIYTTAMPPHALSVIGKAYKALSQDGGSNSLNKLQNNITVFINEVAKLQLKEIFIESVSAIQSCVVSGNVQAKQASEFLREKGYDVRPILSPTVPEGKERLRFCIHSFNSKDEITQVLQHLATFVSHGK